MALKALKLHGTASGPNPWKSVIVLEELGLPYEYVEEAFETIKDEPFVRLNPNGRTPALVDPNKSPEFVIWESNAIIRYLTDTYDLEGKISFKSHPEQHEELQWLFFQASGQGPYYGQASWFYVLHHEQLPSAQARYKDEALRVMGVLDRVLGSKAGADGQAWLVGGRISVADLSFYFWDKIMQELLEALKVPDFSRDKFPHWHKWHAAMAARAAVKATVAHRQALVARDLQVESSDPAKQKAQAYLKANE